MFCGKYNNKRKLGKGTYAQVYLVTDEQGRQYALKKVSFKEIKDESQLRQYLDGEIQSMKAMNSDHLVRLAEIISEKDSVSLVLEYCNGGDLEQYQSRMPNHVIPLEKATEIMSQVIKGMLEIHQNGYAHRDLKTNNILIHKQHDEEIFKVADFSFCKRVEDLNGSILGSPGAMPPEMFDEQADYGNGVDVWAFGITFYLMLNDQLPFSSPFYLQDGKPQNYKKRYSQLKSQAANFSYRKAVEKSSKKLLCNCNQDVQDLFRKIFDVNVFERITFEQMKEHPLFASYFPKAIFSSKILQRAQEKLKRSIILSSTIIKKSQGKGNKFKQSKQKLQKKDSVSKKIHQNPQVDREIKQIATIKESISKLKQQKRQIDKSLREALQAVSLATPTVIEEVLLYFKGRSQECQSQLLKLQLLLQSLERG